VWAKYKLTACSFKALKDIPIVDGMVKITDPIFNCSKGGEKMFSASLGWILEKDPVLIPGDDFNTLVNSCKEWEPD
jgi:hypothetical protein